MNKQSRQCFALFLHWDGNVRKKMRLARGLGQLVPGVLFSYHKLPNDTQYICRHLLSSNYDKCINIRTIAFPKNTASRNSDGWHLCRQDFIQLLWLALPSQRKEQKILDLFFFFAFTQTLICFINKKKTIAKQKVLNQYHFLLTKKKTIAKQVLNQYHFLLKIVFCSFHSIISKDNLEHFNECSSPTLYSTYLDKSQQDQL